MRTTASEAVNDYSHWRVGEIAKSLVDFRRVESCFVRELCVLVHSLIGRRRLRRRYGLVEEWIGWNLVKRELKERIIGSESPWKVLVLWFTSFYANFFFDLCKPLLRRKHVKLRVDLFRWLWKHVNITERPRVFKAAQLSVTDDVRLSLLSMLRCANLPLSHRLLNRLDHLEFFLELIFMTRTRTRKDI